MTLTVFFSLFAFSQMFLCAICWSPLVKRSTTIMLFFILMLLGCGYILGSVYTEIPQFSFLGWATFIAANALPGFFWLVALSVFGDHTELRKWHYIIASATLSVPLTVKLIAGFSGNGVFIEPSAALFIKYFMLAFELALISHALFIAVQFWRDDLVKERRFIRASVISISAIYLIMVIVVEQLLKIDWNGVSLIKSLLLALLAGGINYALFSIKADSLFDISLPKEKKSKEEKVVPKELPIIIQSMEKDKLYRQEGVTISDLSKVLSIHEYKLRHLINGEMNYRNFNDFLNYYRIKEVTEKLSDRELNHIPILTFALDSGFRSLSSFNKSFKNTHGVTPTEYRKRLI